MGRYDPILQALMSGQNQALQLRRDALDQPRPVERFMAGLRAGQERLATSKEQKLKELLNRQAMEEKQRKMQMEMEDREYDISQRPMKELSAQADVDFKQAQARMMGQPKPTAPGDVIYDENLAAWERGPEGLRALLDPTGKQLRKYVEPRSGGASNGLPGGGIRQIVPQEPGQPSIVVYRDGSTGYLQKPTETPASPVTTPRKEIPSSVVKDTARQNANVTEIDQALDTLKNNRDAFNYSSKWVPDAIQQRVDSEGYQARAKAAKIAAVMIHELTGAAQTKAEVDRLQGFLPMAGDTDTTVENKLMGLRGEYKRYLDQTGAAYGGGSYRPNPIVGEQKPPTKVGPNGNTYYLWSDGKYHSTMPK